MNLLEERRQLLKRQIEKLCTAMWQETNDAQRHGLKLLYIDLTAKYETINELIKFRKERQQQCDHNQQQ